MEVIAEPIAASPPEPLVGEEYFPFADMWDVNHPGPPAMHKIILVHPGRGVGPTVPAVSWSDEGTIEPFVDGTVELSMKAPMSVSKPADLG